MIRNLVILLISTSFLSCATMRRWDAQMRAKEQRIVEQCALRDKKVVVETLYTGHRVYWCCDEYGQNCEVLD